MERKSSERNLGMYISTLLCIVAAGFLTVDGIVGHWPWYFYAVLWGQMALIVFTLVYHRIPLGIHALMYSTFTCVTVFLSGEFISNRYLEVVMVCGTLILVSFYHSYWLLIYHMFLSLVTVMVQFIWVRNVRLFTKGDKVEFIFALFLMIGVGFSLYVIIYRDEMARRELRETAALAAQAEKSKSDFLANMSHEIRTPMNAIIGMCELILREGGLSDSVREYCAQIQNSGRSLLSIINDILDFSKIESGKMELIEDEFNIASTLNDVINMTMARMGDKKLEFVVHVNPDIPKGLLGDEIRIRQIMINLLTNAVKYTPDGVIKLDVSRTVRPYGINLIVSVKDSGIGITRENLEKLFNSFQQVDTKKNRSVEGTGLGLVITKRLLTQMGGFISVHSEYGEGSEFRFVIPLKVNNDSPFIQINDADNINAACYINVDKFKNEATRNSYREFLSYIGDSLHVRHHICKRFDELERFISSGRITHCFIGKEEFLANKEYFEKLADNIDVIIIQNRRDGAAVPKNMRCIYKPIYELPIASIFNNENTIVDLMEEKSSSISFTAPKARVLIVDDNAVNLQVAVGLMQPYKMQVLTADSGRDAIRMLGSRDFDIVFMDHMMPEMDGVEATKLIRSKDDPYYKKLPIIALTANAVGGAREMFLANGFDGFVTKPIELSALDRILKQHIPADFMMKVTAEDAEKANKEAAELVLEESNKQYIDAKVGLSYIGNSVSTYMTILGTYIEKGAGKLELLKELFDNKDWPNYIIEVHALKSSSLSVGAKDLSEKSKALELSGKAGDFDFIDKNHAEMMELYVKVLEVGKDILASNSQKDEVTDVKTVVLSKVKIMDMLEVIKAACGRFDADEIAETAAEAEGGVCEGVEIGDDFKAIAEAAADFEFEKAEELIAGVVSKCGLEG